MSTEEDKKVPAPAEAAAIESPPELTEGDAAKPESEASPQETEEKAPSQEADQTPVEEGKSKEGKSEEGKSEEGKSGEESKGSESSTKKPKRKETKKRVRRVGKTEPRKILKTEIDSTPAQVAPTESEAAPPDSAPESASSIEARRVLSKHDEKWNAMFDKLVAYKFLEQNANGHTLVPQCYHEDPRLGRWVHYQRVEYWIFQQSGTGKITPERIARLEGMGFEWDPQKAQWNMLFDKLVKFKEEFGHCKVPKGYAKDTELANWVRNQRLEQANMKKGKKSRMTPERYQKLNDLGFKWSTSIARKGSRKQPDDTPKVEGTTIEDEAAKLEAESPSEADAPVKKEEEEAKGSAAAGETTEVVQI
eukprot:scaffold18138_cov128-Cylindrotheca_fusiformis.AAC.14